MWKTTQARSLDGVTETETDGRKRQGVLIIRCDIGDVRVGLVAGVEGGEGEDQPPRHTQHDQ